MAHAQHIAAAPVSGLWTALVRFERAVEGFALTFAGAFHAARAAERAYDKGQLDRQRLETLIR